MGVSLSNLLADGRFYKADDIRVSSCCTNPSLCREGDLFVATIGSDQDGHDGVVEATQRGIIGVVCERILPVDVPQCVVPNAKSALAAVCHSLAGSPSHRLPVIGIAGVGSLTPTEMLVQRVLELSNHRAAGCNELSFSSGFGITQRISKSMSTAQHARWLAESSANGCTHAVLELSRRDVLNHTYDATRLNSLILTRLLSSFGRSRITPATRNYLDRVMDGLEPDGLLIANIDCPVVDQLVRKLERPVLTVSASGKPGDLTATVLESHPSEQTFLLRAGYDTVAMRSKIIGKEHVQACLLSTAVCLSQGIELANIVAALESVEHIPGHLERVECGQPFSVFADGGATCIDLGQALRTVRSVTRGRLLCVFGPGVTANEKLRWHRGRLVEKYADLPIITCDDFREVDPLRSLHDVLDGIERPAAAHVMPDRLHAIEWALGQCKPGDSLLIVGPHNRTLATHELGFPVDAATARYWLNESNQTHEAVALRRS